MKAIKKLIRTTVSKWIEENPTLEYLKSYSNQIQKLNLGGIKNEENFKK